MPSNLGAMFAYVLSWRDDGQNEGFLEHFVVDQQDRFRMTPMAEVLGRLIA
jgi:hypothetical protein